MWKNIRGLVEKYRKYCYFSKATMCIQGLVFSNSFANHAIVSILITYLTFNWTNTHSTVAAVVTNVQEGVSNIMIILLAHISHSYTGGFKVIATTQAVYILGLFLFWLSAAHMTAANAARVYYGAAALLAVGEAGRAAILREFLDTQYLSQGNTYNPYSQRVLWYLPWFLGTAVPPILVKTTWEQIFMISGIIMGVSYVLFWSGFSNYSVYNKKKHTICVEEETVHPVVEEAQPRDMDTQQDQQAGEETQQYLETQQEEEPSEDVVQIIGNLWTLTKQLKEKGFSLEILALLIPLFGYGFILGTGSTFFYEQMDNLSNPFNNYNPAVYLNVLSSFAKYLISFLWWLLIPESSATRVRIGCGMASCMLCCLTAWQIEIRRMEQMTVAELEGDTSGTISMSIFWLVPQFFLLGAMEGFVTNGVTDFGAHRVRKGDQRIAGYYGSHTQDLIVGIVKLLTALVVEASGDGIMVSRLDKYYRALTIATLVTFCYYFCVAFYFYKSEKSSKEGHRAGVQMEMQK